MRTRATALATWEHGIGGTHRQMLEVGCAGEDGADVYLVAREWAGDPDSPDVDILIPLPDEAIDLIINGLQFAQQTRDTFHREYRRWGEEGQGHALDNGTPAYTAWVASLDDRQRDYLRLCLHEMEVEV